MARELIQLSGDVNPREFGDEYHRALKKIIRKKIKGEDIVVAEPEPDGAEVVDLMDALKATVSAARKGERYALGAPRRKDSRRRGKAAENLDFTVQGRAPPTRPETRDSRPLEHGQG